MTKYRVIACRGNEDPANHVDTKWHDHKLKPEGKAASRCLSQRGTFNIRSGPCQSPTAAANNSTTQSLGAVNSISYGMLYTCIDENMSNHS